MPDVTVLMAVHNGEAFLRRAIDSVLAQTYRDFELLVVDDGSTDGSAAICQAIADARFRLIRLASNRGLSEALNAGLAETRTALVARLDADDEAVPERLARQRDFMQAHPAVAVLGSQATAVTPEGAPTGIVRRSLEAASITWTSVVDNPFIHPTVMFRTSVVRDELGGYRKQFDPFSQDYDLWCRVMEQHQVANLADRLIRLRVHGSSIMGKLEEPAHASYTSHFVDGLSTLVVRQARHVFGATALTEAEARLLPKFVLGVPPSEAIVFLRLFERLLAAFRESRPDTRTPDFRTTLARQFDALAARLSPGSRAVAAQIYLHALRHHPELVTHLSWPRALTSLLLGASGRQRLGGWWRQRHARHH